MPSDPIDRRQPWPRSAAGARKKAIGHMQEARKLAQELIDENFANIHDVEVNVAYIAMHVSQAELVLIQTKVEQDGA